jgi:hypothetical protein
VRTNVLLMHAKEDTVIPFTHSVRLFNTMIANNTMKHKKNISNRHPAEGGEKNTCSNSELLDARLSNNNSIVNICQKLSWGTQGSQTDSNSSTLMRRERQYIVSMIVTQGHHDLLYQHPSWHPITAHFLLESEVVRTADHGDSCHSETCI